MDSVRKQSRKPSSVSEERTLGVQLPSTSSSSKPNNDTLVFRPMQRRMTHTSEPDFFLRQERVLKRKKRKIIAILFFGCLFLALPFLAWQNV